jgi:hypothetical protein
VRGTGVLTVGNAMRCAARAGGVVAVAAVLAGATAGSAGAEARTVPQNVAFGPQRAGTQSEPQVVELVNIGQHPMYVHRGVVNSGPDNADFLAVKDGCTDATVAPGERCAVELAFKPHAEGATSQTYGFDVSGLDYRLLAERAAVVTLTGTGLPGPPQPRPTVPPDPVPIGLYLPVAGFLALGLGCMLLTFARRGR